MAFNVSPAAPFPPQTGNDPPSFIQFQADGVDLGGPDADTVNFSTGLTVTRGGSGENENIVTLSVEAVPIDVLVLTWRDVEGDASFVLGDASNGIATTGTTGMQTLTIPDDGTVPFEDGTAVLIFQEGAASVVVVGAYGVDLLCRDTLVPVLAGQYATATIIKRSANTWLICGDLAHD